MVEIKTLKDTAPGVQEVMVIDHYDDGTSYTHTAIRVDKELSEAHSVVDKLDILSRALKCEETHNKLI